MVKNFKIRQLRDSKYKRRMQKTIYIFISFHFKTLLLLIFYSAYTIQFYQFVIYIFQYNNNNIFAIEQWEFG